MNAIKAILSAIVALVNVITKFASAAERVATATDELARAGEVKARNFTALIELNDEAAFHDQQQEIMKRREKLGLSTEKVKSQQELKLKLPQ